jgi:polyisoprenoid-binding protein YceI
MKNIFYTITIIILLAVAAFLVISPDRADAPEGQNPEIVEEVVIEEPLDAPAVVYDTAVDIERSEIQWVAGKRFLVDWIDEGMITLQSAQMAFVPGAEDIAFRGEFIFDMSSIEVTKTGSGGGFGSLQRHLESEDFFDVENNPTAKFVITGGEGLSVEGDLTIKGITKSVSFDLDEWNIDEAYISGSVTVDRTDFGINYGSESLIGRIENQVINDTFELNFKIYHDQA